jgi:hypothetical protein
VAAELPILTSMVRTAGVEPARFGAEVFLVFCMVVYLIEKYRLYEIFVRMCKIMCKAH